MKNIENYFLNNKGYLIAFILTFYLLFGCNNRSITDSQILISSNNSEIDTISNIVLQNITIDSVIINDNYIPDKYFDSIINETIKYRSYISLKGLKKLKIDTTIKNIKFRYPYILKSNFNDIKVKNDKLINYVSFSKPYINKKEEIILYCEYYVNSFHAGGDIYIFYLNKNNKIILKNKYLIWKS